MTSSDQAKERVEQRWSIRKGPDHRHGMKQREVIGPDTEPIEVVPASLLEERDQRIDQLERMYELQSASILHDNEHRQKEKQLLRERDRVLGELLDAITEGENEGWPMHSQNRFLAANDQAAALLARTKEGGEARDPGSAADDADETRPTLSPSEPCPECNGDGTITVNVSRNLDPQQERDERCPNCHGTGEAPNTSPEEKE